MLDAAFTYKFLIHALVQAAELLHQDPGGRPQGGDQAAVRGPEGRGVQGAGPAQGQGPGREGSFGRGAAEDRLRDGLHRRPRTYLCSTSPRPTSTMRSPSARSPAGPTSS